MSNRTHLILFNLVLVVVLVCFEAGVLGQSNNNSSSNNNDNDKKRDNQLWIGIAVGLGTWHWHQHLVFDIWISVFRYFDIWHLGILTFGI